MGNVFDFEDKLDFNDIDLTAPNDVIKHLADQLESETNGIILGKIESYSGHVVSYIKPGLSGLAVALGTAETKVDIQTTLGKQGEEIKKFEFYITTPLYSKYKYRICYLQHGIGNYPVKIVLEQNVANEVFSESSANYIIQCQTPDELENIIVKAIYSKTVLSVMQELIRINQIRKNEISEFDSIYSPVDEETT